MTQNVMHQNVTHADLYINRNLIQLQIIITHYMLLITVIIVYTQIIVYSGKI